MFLIKYWIRRVDLNLSKNTGRIPSHTMKGWNVFGHNTSCTNCYASTYSDARKHYNIPAKPAVLANGNWLTKFWTVCPVPEKGIEGMSGRVESTIWSDEGASPYCDETGVQESTVEVDIDTSPESTTPASINFTHSWVIEVYMYIP